MDLFVIEKLLESRKKSVAACSQAVDEAVQAAGKVTPGPVRKILESKVKLQKARLTQLKADVAALEAEWARLQPELPGVAKAPPAKR